MIKVYKDNIIEGLKDLASYQFQKTAWFENEYKLYSSFDEDVESVFLGSALGDAFDEGQIVFGKDADDALKKLEAACNELGYEWSGREKELLESQGMKIIREMAKCCLQKVRGSNGSESTVEIADSGMLPLGLSFSDRDDL